MDTTYRRRRPLVRGAALGGALALTLTGCDFFSTDPATDEGQDVEATGEAPMLAELVEAGELPPLEERLPEEPLVVEPNDRVGTYGGEWNMVTTGIGDWPLLGRTVAYENLTRWDPEWEEVIPNLAESWEYNEDATEVTITLREGLRWSDGEPFTSEDIEFANNDIYNNADLTDEALRRNPGEVEVEDETTFRIVWEEPQAKWMGADLLHYQIVSKAKHYFEEYHLDYNEDAEELAEEEGYDSWEEMFNDRSGANDSERYFQNADIPTMHPWVIVEPLADTGSMVLERNPYYWKIDTEGNQLPYIDRVVLDVIQDTELMVTRAANGDIDMMARHFNTLENRPVLADNRETGDYEFFELIPAEMNTNVIAFNLTHEDDVLREVFNDRDFRVALSHAIDRQEIIDVVYQEQGEPWQAAPREDVPFFSEELAKQYTEFDPELAEEILDEAGYDERDSDGFRMSPDGEEITFDLTVATEFRDDQIDAMEMVEGFWQDIGIDVRLSTENRDLFYERKENNEHDVNVWSGDGGMLDAIYDARWYVPMQSGESNYAIPWAQWLVSDGQDERGQEPPDDVQEQYDLWHYDLNAAVEPEEQHAVMEEILEIAQEQFYAIGISLTPPSYGVVRNNFHNVPESMPSAANYNDPGPTNPEQYFIEEE